MIPCGDERWGGRPVPPPQRSLRQLSAPHLLTHLAAVLDELIDRVGAGGLPSDLPVDKLHEDLLYPMLIGRALRATDDNASKAGEVIRGSKLDFSESKPDRRRKDQYSRLAKLIDESLIERLRGGLR